MIHFVTVAGSAAISYLIVALATLTTGHFFLIWLLILAAIYLGVFVFVELD